jgi:hypothetical protein
LSKNEGDETWNIHNGTDDNNNSISIDKIIRYIKYKKFMNTLDKKYQNVAHVI